mmetsp:Transcript_5817/g.15176  ORF Transcript_5817/g.15176 Transcript_5817/m.15176 type:complete len:240 (+) Transcript_5817:758-1477(+)
MLEKESSRMTMSEAALAMLVPPFIPKPTSAARSAGASFVPSPVIANTSRRPDVANPGPLCVAWSFFTISNLCVGVHRASTRTCGHMRANASTSADPSARVTRSLKRWASMTASGPSSASKMPTWRAMLAPVEALSPVSIRTVIPAFWHCRMAEGTSGLIGSCSPTSPTRTRPSSTESSPQMSTELQPWSEPPSLKASAITLRLLSPSCRLSASGIGTSAPSACIIRVHLRSRTSGAPFT